MDAGQHLAEIRARLLASLVIAEVEVVAEIEAGDQGYFRARLKLGNRDFLEVVEYFVIVEEAPQVRRYRHQWMNAEQTELKRRWDNAPHFPGLPDAPHHIHEGAENAVSPGQPTTILQLLDWLEAYLAGDHTDA